jgi:glycolate oxidase FAD binding subunit
VGSLGTLAVITEVAFRLHPLPEVSRTVVLESRSVSDLCGFATRVGRLQVTPSLVDIHWPQGVAVVRFDSSEAGAGVQADRVVHDVGGRILSDDDATTLHASVAGSPWTGEGIVCSVAVLPSRAVELLSILSATCDAISLRPLLGTGEIRFAADALGTVAQAVRAAGGHMVVRRGAGAPAGTVDDPVALELMRSVKLQLDPARTLSPGRQVGGI